MVPEQYLLNELFNISISHKSNNVPPEFHRGAYDQLTTSLRAIVPLTHTSISSSTIPHTDLSKGKFVPEEIVRDINSFSGKADKYATTFANNTVPVEFFVYGPHTTGVLSELRALLPVIEWMCADVGMKPVSVDTAPPTPLTIHLYMGSAKKKFPESPETTITYKHCNAAVTWTCNVSGEVLIYRREEWGKTLLHELFHSLCLDMVGVDGGAVSENEMNEELTRIFHLPGKPEFRETYCEWWATVLYCAATALQHGRDTDTLTRTTFNHVFQECVEIERHHSFVQVTKLLRFWQVEWCDFLKHHMCHNINVDRPKRPIPKEATNVFCYFILRCVLFHDIGATLRVMGRGDGALRLKRTFSVPNMTRHIRHVAYGDDFDITTQSYDRALQIIVSRVYNSRMSDAHKSAIVSHITRNFRMTAGSGWII
jgi:hypothetical protein